MSSVVSTVNNLEVLYEDNHIIAVNKRSSDIVQGDKTGDIPLSEVVKLWLKKKYNKPGNVFAGVVHRLDRPVSGVVVFAKTSKSLSRLNQLFKDQSVEKTYVAAVCAPPASANGRLEHYLIKNPKQNKSQPVSSKNKKAKKAILDYRLIGKSETYYFVEIKPHTGRHHQIRVQLAAMGCSIKGDLKYGAPRSNKDGSIHLHAFRLSFIHPVSKEKLLIEAPFPTDPVWNAVAKMT